jgi:hypothetical protein
MISADNDHHASGILDSQVLIGDVLIEITEFQKLFSSELPAQSRFLLRLNRG